MLTSENNGEFSWGPPDHELGIYRMNNLLSFWIDKFIDIC